jgi:hypothetical protein
MSKRAALGATGVFGNPPPAAQAEPVAAKPPAARNDRAGRAPMPFWTTLAAKKQLRIMAAESDTTQQDLMTEALNNLIQKHGKPPIA